jgi:hypothetical protein
MPSTQFRNASVLALAAGFLQLAQTDAVVQYSWPRHGGPEHCRTFGKELKRKNTDVQNVTYYSNAQTVQLPGADATCSQSTDVSVPLCRLSLFVHTSSSSQVKMEIWLPDDWSGRVAAVGNGGLNGCRFSWSSVAHESRRLVESLVLARIIFSRNHSLHSMTLGTSRWPSIILVLDSTTRVHHWALG